MTTRWMHWLLGMGLACGATGLLAACGDDKKSGDSGDSSPTKVALQIKDAGGGKFTLTAPKTVDAGLSEITLTTPAGDASHDAQLIRVEGDHSVEETVKIINQESAPIPAWLIPAGGPGATPGGKTATVTQNLVPGKYYVIDTNEPEGDNVKSYGEDGTVAEFEVTGDAGDAALPKTDATITAKDFSFETSGLKAGTNRLTFTNTGKEIHHVIVAPFAKGATFDQVKKAFTQQGEPSGPPPVDFSRLTNTAAIDAGGSQVTDIDLKPGKYALLCFISDRTGGPPHVAKGMIVETTVE
jgi:hypothetical protein